MCAEANGLLKMPEEFLGAFVAYLSIVKMLLDLVLHLLGKILDIGRVQRFDGAVINHIGPVGVPKPIKRDGKVGVIPRPWLYQHCYRLLSI